MDTYLQKNTEMSVIGAAIGLSNQSKIVVNVIKTLEPDHFYYSVNKKIWKAIKALHKEGISADIITIVAKLKELRYSTNPIDGVDPLYLVDISGKYTSSDNITVWAMYLLESYFREIMKKVLIGAANKMEEHHNDVLEVHDETKKKIEQIEKKVVDLMKTVSGSGDSSVIEIVENELDQMEQDLDMNVSTGISYGIPNMDGRVDPMIAGDFIIIAARPGMGKSIMALQIAMNAAINLNIPVNFFSLEMTKAKLSHRIIAMITEFTTNQILYRKVAKNDISAIRMMANRRLNKNLIIHDNPDLTVNQMQAIAEKNRSKLMIVDYLQLVTSGDKGNREQEVSTISRDMKKTGMKLRIPVIALSQLSRRVEERSSNGFRPQLSDLRESGSLEQDADTVLFLYRPGYYKGKVSVSDYPENISEIIVAKQRNGKNEVVLSLFDTKTNQFTKYENDQNQDTGLSEEDRNREPGF